MPEASEEDADFEEEYGDDGDDSHGGAAGRSFYSSDEEPQSGQSPDEDESEDEESGQKVPGLSPELKAYFDEKLAKSARRADRVAAKLARENRQLRDKVDILQGADNPSFVPCAPNPYIIRGPATLNPQQPQLLNVAHCERTGPVFELCRQGERAGELSAKAKEFATVACLATYLHDLEVFCKTEIRKTLKESNRTSLSRRLEGSLRGITRLTRNRYTYLKVTETGEVDGDDRKALDHDLYGPLIFGRHDEGGDIVDYIAAQRAATATQLAVQAAKAAAQKLAKGGDAGAPGAEAPRTRRDTRQGAGTRRGGAAAREKRDRSKSRDRKKK